MINLRKSLAFLLMVGLSLSAVPLSLAEDAALISMVQQVKINLTQAINVAESHAGGKAVSAELDDDTPVYDVEVLKDGKFFEVKVDALTGKVLSMHQDLDD